MCFYCKYGIYAGGLQTVLGVLWVKGGLPTGYLAFVVILLSLVFLQRQAKREMLTDEAEARDKRYFKANPTATKTTPAGAKVVTKKEAKKEEDSDDSTED